MTKYLIVAVALLIGLLSFQSWRLESSQKAEAIATAENGKLETAIVNLNKKLVKEREANNNAQLTYQQQLKTSTKRRQLAETAYYNLSKQAHAWDINIVPADITAGLCISPGSCSMSNAGPGTRKPANTGSGTGIKKHFVLNNKSLRIGIEDFRDSLGKCNAKINGVAAWASVIQKPGPSTTK